MALLDWFILSIYFVGLIVLSFWVGKRQKGSDDYFLGGRKIHGGVVALSLAANQVSAISLIGAPAFVALRSGGGLRWLQYEFAVPLAMIAIMFILLPLYRRLSGATIYEYLENRFGVAARLVLSAIFMISRGLATGVVLYTSALVLAVTLNQPIVITLSLIGLVAIIYTSIGGITADVLSDAFQLIVLWIGTIAAVLAALSLVGGFGSALSVVSADRIQTIDFMHLGLGDGRDFAFWPMLIGGFFLYFSYYGCDQSQAQRLMSTPSAKSSRNSLLINGIIRFPIVLSYCALGLLLAAFVINNPDFITSNNIDKDSNYLVPVFIIKYLPTGIVGLVMAGIFAATMSTIDSNLNSLSAVTMSDYIGRFFPEFARKEKKFLLWSRMATFLWGVFCIVSGYYIAQSSKTVIELVNMIGSAFYGPILAVFIAGAFLKRADGTAAILGLMSGLGINIILSKTAPGVSWLWWNPIGFFSAFGVSWLYSLVFRRKESPSATWTLRSIVADQERTNWLRDWRTWAMVAVFAAIIFMTAAIGGLVN